MTAPLRSRTDALQEWALVTLAIAAVTIAATWPLATSAWLVPAHQDPLFSSWRLYQWARNLSGQWPGGLFDGNIFAPTRDVLLFSDAIPLLAVPAAPFLWMGVPLRGGLRDAGLAVVPQRRPGDVRLCARAHRQPVWRVRRRGDLHGGARRIEHVMHLELLWTAWLPLVVLGTVRLLSGQAGGARLAGSALAAQFLSCIYYGVFMITLWPLLAGLEWVRTRPPLSRRLVVTSAGWMLAAVVVAGVYAIPYQRARAVVGDREDFEIDKLRRHDRELPGVPAVEPAAGMDGGAR